MYKNTIYTFRVWGMALVALFCFSCKKWVVIDDPTDSLTTPKMFRTEELAESALMGIYNSLAQGPNQNNTHLGQGFAAGMTTRAGGLSAGELYSSGNLSQSLADNNIMNASYLWASAYHAIYLANSVIDGIATSESTLLRDSVRQQYTAEAKLLRAFSYLYLTSFFGDVPLVLTIDFNKTKLMPRSSKADVFTQIFEDLNQAYEALPSDYIAGQGERVRVNKWVAAALLARSYLYLGDFQQAESFASEVINQTELFHLENLTDVFLTDSREAIFQLHQSSDNQHVRNATIGGYQFLPDPLHEGIAYTFLSEDFAHSFEAGDARAESWIDSTFQTAPGGPGELAWYPTKYKVGKSNSVLGEPPAEYHMVIRLAEMYLIRAEARAQGAGGGSSMALEDINTLRRRAELEILPQSLSDTEVLDAVWKARAMELFAEWGHRWMDLRRSGKAVEVLSVLPANQPWEGDWQLLYPIPISEIRNNKNLIQNPGYDQR